MRFTAFAGCGMMFTSGLVRTFLCGGAVVVGSFSERSFGLRTHPIPCWSLASKRRNCTRSSGGLGAFSPETALQCIGSGHRGWTAPRTPPATGCCWRTRGARQSRPGPESGAGCTLVRPLWFRRETALRSVPHCDDRKFESGSVCESLL